MHPIPSFVQCFCERLNTGDTPITCWYSIYELISILLYADDIVLLSANERDMQIIVNCLASWCNAWGLTINFNKSKMVHFRAPSVHRSEVEIECGVSKLEFVDSYKYLGVLFTKHLDYNLMTKMVAQSASRALGLLISKDKSFGGMPYDCFTKCYNATVQATIDYSAAVWGTKSVSCVNAILEIRTKCCSKWRHGLACTRT